jgi:hypothetical protein
MEGRLLMRVKPSANVRASLTISEVMPRSVAFASIDAGQCSAKVRQASSIEESGTPVKELA